MNKENIFFTDPIDGDCPYTWSIVSRFGKLIRIAEALYGPRDKSFTIYGVELVVGDEAQPSIWHPVGIENIIVQINSKCIDNPQRAIFELAHEVVHCLHPSRKDDTTVLEEGLAVYFSAKMSYDLYELGEWHVSDNYSNAYNAVSPLIEQYPNFIKDLRKGGTGAISAITLDDYNNSEYSGLIENIDQLLEKFDYTDGGRVPN